MRRRSARAEDANRNRHLREAEREQRARNIENTIGTLRIEGLEIDAETVVMDRYIDGELIIDDVVAILCAPPSAAKVGHLAQKPRAKRKHRRTADA